MSHKISKRHLFKTAFALAGASALGACVRERESVSNLNTSSEKSLRYDCHGKHQAGITTPHQHFAIIAAFDVMVKDVAELKKIFQIISQRIEFLTQGGELHDSNRQLPPSGSGLLGKTLAPNGLTITVGVGASLFDQRFGLQDKKPKHLVEMPDFPNDKLQADWCDGDVSLQICATNPETCQNALRDFIKQLAGLALIRWGIDGFLPQSPQGQAPRNLFGFRDGTANPDVAQENIANQVLWTGVAANALDEPAWTKNGTYQAIRLIRQFVEFWDRTPLQEQEAIFGRDKYSGAPLGMKHEHDPIDYQKNQQIASDSHIHLANPRTPDFMAKHQLYRRPFNYSRGLSKAGQLDVGLIFICYQANLADGFVFVQEKLNLEPLEEYIQPFGGGYFFVLAGFEKGGYLGESLLA
ncbi:iron uptake transporter deferrochelatase/peroxidase subunit [Alysiella filiformis]|uniref:Deferrochelatase n=1 Tax=Alysiella filiformis DSM 16848 TaxID=1120981 RepID=A0A286EB26_9NEIS|nr:iron uptake transporter deferrochelatase/peroxidase subunit [Alysiella filiformis]QMT32219.1 deferrochelatase/peroxidase EfeB [Alysiella filiformis]UBQ56861.1 deferrochelatase/peroxidase EfeB [Alysiella filiformis DSM 16848]SOD68121.1 deferrochelatase/peroxidase EfeB [Alysiella filiformis DSM 16848]